MAMSFGNSGYQPVAMFFNTMNYQMDQMSAEYEAQEEMEQAVQMQENMESQVEEVMVKQSEAQQGDSSTAVFSPNAKSESAAGPWSDPNLVYSLNLRG
ncbi:MAG TPA: hypothetical protein V6C52_08695 [Coleofasciculaceae cyanobacterium]